MNDIIWLSPSLAAGAIARRLVAFFERRPQIRSRRGVERAVATTRLFIIGFLARGATHQCGSRLLVNVPGSKLAHHKRP